MHDAMRTFARALAHVGVEFTPADPLPFEGICVGRACESGGTADTRTIGGIELLEDRDLDAGIFSDHATFAVGARLPDVLERHGSGARVLELGCGTGLLAVLAARLGSPVTATDVDTAALDLATRNAAANGVELDLREGSVLEPIAPRERFDLVIANLPHKPSCVGRGIWEIGGEEGDALWSQALAGLDEVLTPGGGLLFFLHSLPHPRLLLSISRATDLHLLSWKIRLFEEDEFPHAREALRERHARGTSFVLESDGAMGMVAGVWHGVLREPGA